MLGFVSFEIMSSLLGAAAFALDFNPYEGPKPVVVILQSDPWLMVIGSDTPLLAIYEDGLVVFSRDRSQGNYLQKKLRSEELVRVFEKIRSFGSFKSVRPWYNLAPGVTDLPETSIFLDIESMRLTTTVYGMMVRGQRPAAFTRLPTDEKPKQPPRSVVDLHDYLSALAYADAEPWLPKYIEVMVWPYEYAPDESIVWPRTWPGIESGSAAKRGDSYSIFVAGDRLAALDSLLKTQRARGAVLISGRKWAVARRPVFPSEPVWRRAIYEAQEK